MFYIILLILLGLLFLVAEIVLLPGVSVGALLALVCDGSAYAAEAEQCKAVVEKYNKGLLCGFLEPESTIPAFLRELEDAGINAIIQEKQRQLDAWLAQNGK